MNQPNTLTDDALAHPAQDELPIDRPRASGFVLQRIDVPAALDVLDSFLEDDEAEQQETFEYLKRSLNETRAAHGERPLFPNERSHSAGCRGYLVRLDLATADRCR